MKAGPSRAGLSRAGPSRAGFCRARLFSHPLPVANQWLISGLSVAYPVANHAVLLIHIISIKRI